MMSRMEDATNAVSLWNVTWVINKNIVVEQIDDVKKITDRSQIKENCLKMSH